MRANRVLTTILLMILAVSGYACAPGDGPSYDPGVMLDPNAQIAEDQTYTVVLHLPLLPLTIGTTTFENAVRNVVASFVQVQQQARVELHLVPLSAYHKSLGEQVASSTDPVVALSIDSPPTFFGQNQLLPVTKFIAAYRDSYWPISLAALEYEGHLWGWPAWLRPGFLVAREPAIRESKGLDELYQLGAGWSPGEFRSFLQSMKTNTPLVATGPPVDLFSAFVVAAEGSWLPFDSEGQYQWQDESVLQAATELGELVEAGLIADPDSTPTSSLRALYTARGAVVTGMDAWVVLNGKLRHKPVTLRLLPLPTGRSAPITPVRVTSFQVFRGVESQSPAHYLVANELARYTASELAAWVGTATLAVPASQPALENWARALSASWDESDPAGWHNIEQAVAWTMATGVPASPPTARQHHVLDRFYKNTLSPALRDLMAGTLTPEQFVTRVTPSREQEH